MKDETQQTDAENAKMQYEMMRKAFNEVIRLAKLGLRNQSITQKESTEVPEEEREKFAMRGLESITFVSTFLKGLDENVDAEIEDQLK
jgi:hypothetical protein